MKNYFAEEMKNPNYTNYTNYTWSKWMNINEIRCSCGVVEELHSNYIQLHLGSLQLH